MYSFLKAFLVLMKKQSEVLPHSPVAMGGL